MLARGHTRRVSTGALAASVQDPGPFRGTSTAWPPARTPATTPLETFTPTPDPFELSFEAVAVKELDARRAGLGAGAVVVDEGVVVVVEVEGVTVVDVERASRLVVSPRGDTVTWGDRCARADVVIEKSITSRRTGLDHITS